MIETDDEAIALRWLMMIPRLNWKTTTPRKSDHQITIHICPPTPRGDGTMAAMLVHIRVVYPRPGHRQGDLVVRGSGNYMGSAVHDLWQQLDRHKIYMPPPGVDITPEAWAAQRTKVQEDVNATH